MPHLPETPSNSELVNASRQARQQAIAPYSNFRVGAALQTAEGRIYTAGNIETSSYGLTICAERVALFKALSEGERHFTALAVATGSDEFCTPCGACRQVLWDFARELEVILVNQKGETRRFSLADLLPNAFDSRFLHVHEAGDHET